MRYSSIAIVVGLLAVFPSCKGKEGGSDAKLSEKIESYKSALDEANKARAELETELAEIRSQVGETVVAIKGDGGILSITGAPGPNGRDPANTPAVGTAKDEELYKKFIAAVKGARSPMTQCYRRALKNDSKLQARTVRVTVKVNYASSGKVTKAETTPNINGPFNTCIRGVASKWKLPAMPKPASFVAPLTLTPET